MAFTQMTFIDQILGGQATLLGPLGVKMDKACVLASSSHSFVGKADIYTI